MWKYDGSKRPVFATQSSPTQESVWDYPRPPALQQDSRTVSVYDGKSMIAKSARCYRLLETASPPTFYIPAADIDMDLLQAIDGSSNCEWKGRASYWALKRDDLIQMLAWSYPSPANPFTPLKDHFAFYPGRIDCFIDDERVRPQDGGFYGGWVSNEIIGPWKGNQGTGHW
jgi:uncharacterized protein (DUF427 family)